MIFSLILIGESISAHLELRSGFVCLLACTSAALGRGEQQALYGWGICKPFVDCAHVFRYSRLELSPQQFLPLSFARLKEEQ